MKELTLADFLRRKGTQPQLAKAVGLTQSAICQMAKSARNIRVRILDDGGIQLIELRLLNKPKIVSAEGSPTMTQTIPVSSSQHSATSGAVNSASVSQASH